MIFASIFLILSFIAYTFVLYHSRVRRVMSFYASILLIFNMLMALVYLVMRNMSYVQSIALIEMLLLFSTFMYMLYHVKMNNDNLSADDYTSLMKQYFFSGLSFVIALLTVGMTYLIALIH